jgi:hypothetical protein
MNHLLNTSASPAWLRRIVYGLFQVALLAAYLVGSLAAWKRSLHGAGHHYWRPIRAGFKPRTV